MRCVPKGMFLGRMLAKVIVMMVPCKCSFK